MVSPRSYVPIVALPFRLIVKSTLKEARQPQPAVCANAGNAFAEVR